MKDEFSNENMLKILIEQKKYLEAFRIYKELMKSGSIADPSVYKSLLIEVSKIDPVLTMDRATREKKVSRLSKILNKIRRIATVPRGRKQEDIRDAIKPTIIAEATVALKMACSETEEVVKEKVPYEKPADILQAIESFTAQSINSIISIICGNFSNDVLSKKPVSNRIEILQEMLRRIEIIKNQRKKEPLNV